MSLEPGEVIDGKYRIVRLIGEGGMGSVHEGENVLISRRVAIKVLHAAAAENEQIIKRFEREAQAAGRIGSDHILEVLDLGSLPNGDRYMVMEYLQGEELSNRIERLGSVPPLELARLIRQALVGLKAAHSAGIIHRDLKPDNVFILEEKAGTPDYVKIIDFGISKFSALSGDMSMTTTGAVMGTPYYMSPEQAKGSSQLDARADLYAVGVIMYEALTGNVPFSGTSFNDLMFKIVLSDPPPLPESIPEGFRVIVQKAMAREANERYQTAEDFIVALEDWAATQGASLRQSQHGASVTTAVGATMAGAPTDTRAGPGSPPQTNVNWASTKDDDQVAGIKKPPLPLLLGGGGVVAVAGIALAIALSGSGAKPDEEKEEDLAARAEEEEQDQEEAESPVAPPEEKKEPLAKDEELEEKEKDEPQEEEKQPTAKKEKAAPAPAPAPAPRPVVRPRPRPKPKPKPKPSTDFDDFGY